MTPDDPSASDPFRGFSRGELQRYARHFSLEEVGGEGQRRLKNARVLLIGAGGLGSPASLYLAAAGVGTLGIIDSDQVELSNLQRQIVHGTPDVDRPKVESARDRLRQVNPHVTVEAHRARLTSANARSLVRSYDLVVDGSDNFPTRYLVNDACVMEGRPWVYGAILRWEGQLALFGVPGGPCYRCLFREPPPPGLVPGCAEAGVVGVLPGIIGSLQALEAIKWILMSGEGSGGRLSGARSMAGRLLIFDALDLSFREVGLDRDPACPVCGDEPSIHELMDYDHFCATGEYRPAGADEAAHGGAAVGTTPVATAPDEVDPTTLARELGDASGQAVLLVDVREPWEWEVSNLADRGALHLPLRSVPEEMERLPRDRDIVVYCRTGARSAEAVQLLREGGFLRVRNLVGGLRRWADEVEPELTVA
jgi:sulfur-carrier protein adenylyltransferase/sulfurtransferase